MAVAKDATATVQVGAAVTTQTNTTLTIGGSGTGLVAIFISNTAVTSVTAHWDSTGTNQSMTQIGTFAISGGNMWMFGLVNPTTGNKTLSCSWTTAANILLGAISFTGSDTTSVANAFKNFTTNNPTGTSGTLTVTSAASGNFQVCVASQNVTTWSSLAATGSVTAFNDATHVAGICASTASSSGLVWTATPSGSTTMGICGCEVVVPAAAAPALNLYNRSHQLQPILAQ